MAAGRIFEVSIKERYGRSADALLHANSAERASHLVNIAALAAQQGDRLGAQRLRSRLSCKAFREIADSAGLVLDASRDEKSGHIPHVGERRTEVSTESCSSTMIASHGDCAGARFGRPLAAAMEFWAANDLRPVTECPACGAPPITAKAAIRIDGLAVKECPACTILYVDPIPNEAALARCFGSHYYGGANQLATHVGYPCGDSYYAGRQSSLSNGGPLGFDAISGALDLKAKSILEIGCADGALLQSLRRHTTGKRSAHNDSTIGSGFTWDGSDPSMASSMQSGRSA
jgi:hypothetical protein